jgi:prefoldin subunit 2
MSVADRFNKLRQELKELQTKTAQFESDEQEHLKVLETVVTLPEDRKCYRQIGEVLVTTNARDAKIFLEQQCTRLHELVATFQLKVADKEKELIDFQRENNIQLRPFP